MSSNNTTNPWFLFGAAVVGIVSAAGVYLAEYYRQERMRHSMAQDLARLDNQLDSMRIQLDHLQKLQREKHHRTSGRKRAVRTSSIVSDGYSTTKEIDSSDLEYYDLTSDDDETNFRPIETSYEEVDVKLTGDALSVAEALLDLTARTASHPDDVNALWRTAKACHKLSNGTDDADAKRRYIDRGVEACKRAEAIDPEVAQVHKWLAILIGSRGELQPLKDRIQDGYLFKGHVDKALTLDPDDESLHHMLGRFAFEVAGLKWYERKAAAAFFAEPPQATFSEALDHCLEAERLCPRQWKENKFLVGKIHLAQGDYGDGVAWLEKAAAIRCQDLHEEKMDSEIKTLIAKFNGYR